MSRRERKTSLLAQETRILRFTRTTTNFIPVPTNRSPINQSLNRSSLAAPLISSSPGISLRISFLLSKDGVARGISRTSPPYLLLLFPLRSSPLHLFFLSYFRSVIDSLFLRSPHSPLLPLLPLLFLLASPQRLSGRRPNSPSTRFEAVETSIEYHRHQIRPATGKTALNLLASFIYQRVNSE